MKTKKLGKLEALYKCYLLWDWLAKNPDMDKEDWPGWKKENKEVENNCFACEHSIQHNYICNNKGCIIPIFNPLGCLSYLSHYIKWDLHIARKANAQRIADSAYKEYKRLGGKKK
jgi:hypothetical protein